MAVSWFIVGAVGEDNVLGRSVLSLCKGFCSDDTGTVSPTLARK